MGFGVGIFVRLLLHPNLGKIQRNQHSSINREEVGHGKYRKIDAEEANVIMKTIVDERKLQNNRNPHND